MPWVLVLLTGCDSISGWLERKRNAHTTRGYDSCIKSNSDVQLSELTIKRLCLQRHATVLDFKIGGGAGYNCDFGNCSFSGFLQNKASDQVITGLMISVRHHDNTDDKGNIKTELATVEGLWIEPNMSEKVYFTGLTFQPAKHRLYDGATPLYTWSLITASGLQIRLQ